MFKYDCHLVKYIPNYSKFICRNYMIVNNINSVFIYTQGKTRRVDSRLKEIFVLKVLFLV